MILPQIISIGIFNSSVNRKNTKISKKRTTTMFEIELPMDNGGISYINNTHNPIKDNCIICAKPGQLRYTKFPYKCYYIHLILKNDSLFNTLSNLPDFIETNNKEKYVEMFKELISRFNSFSDDNEIMVQSLVLKLIYNISKDAKIIFPSSSPQKANSTIIEESVKYIKNNLTEDLTLETLSAKFNLCPTHYHNIFKYNTGVTLREYVENQRIKKATNLLISTNLSLAQIAYECGFSSQSYFSFVFKRKFNTTPRKYAEKINILYES